MIFPPPFFFCEIVFDTFKVFNFDEFEISKSKCIKKKNFQSTSEETFNH